MSFEYKNDFWANGFRFSIFVCVCVLSFFFQLTQSLNDIITQKLQINSQRKCYKTCFFFSTQRQAPKYDYKKKKTEKQVPTIEIKFGLNTYRKCIQHIYGVGHNQKDIVFNFRYQKQNVQCWLHSYMADTKKKKMGKIQCNAMAMKFKNSNSRIYSCNKYQNVKCVALI